MTEEEIQKKYPLPDPFYWDLDAFNEPCIRHSANTEQVAWMCPPGNGMSDFEGKWECVSAPKGVFGSHRYHRDYADTMEEAVSLIFSFAILEIRKDE